MRNLGQELKRIACVIPPFYRLIESKNNRIEPAMHYVAEILHRSGHEVVYINGDYGDAGIDYAERYSITCNNWLFEERYKNGHSSYDNIIDILKEFKPDFVFISAGNILMPTVETGSSQSCAIVAEKIKCEISKDIVCIGYGHLLKYASEDIKNKLDVIITSEAEVFLKDIVEGGVTGELPLSWCENLDDLPILTGDYMYYDTQIKDWDYIMSMRGCPGSCTFCQQPTLRGGHISTMSPERFIRELRYRINKIGIVGFYFTDMIFCPGNTPRTLEMLERLCCLKEEYPDFNWWSEMRVDNILNDERLKLLKRSGCRHIKFGVEMADQRMLNTVKKNITMEEIQRTFQLLKNHEISKTVYVLLGCPGFNDSDYRNMWHVFNELKADNYVININVPYIGTELYEQVKDKLHDYGIFNDGEESFIHTSLIMKEFWGISDETLDMYFSLQGKKDDSVTRNYISKIVDKAYYDKTREIRYI